MTVTLNEIRVRATDNDYPLHLLDRCDTALVLFAAGFHGQQDGIFLADAGLTATCVDRDERRLHDMAAVYPESWQFVATDVFEFADSCEERFDLLSIDPSSNHFQGCADRLKAWCSLARVAVVLGTGVGTRVVAPRGWKITDRRQRSDYLGGVFWTVLEERA